MNHCQIRNRVYQVTSSVGFLIYSPTMAFAKATVVGLYLRIFASVRWIRITAWLIIISYTLACLTLFSVTLVVFIRQNWKNQAQEGINLEVFITVNGALTIIADCILLSIPIKPISKMALPPSKKYSLLAIFLVGAGATMCSIIVFGWSIRYYYFMTGLPVNFQDWTWTLAVMNVMK